MRLTKINFTLQSCNQTISNLHFMANNVIVQSVYQINSNQTFTLSQVPQIAFPTQGCLLRAVTDPTDGSPGGLVLANGVRAYGKIQLAATGDQYYVQATLSQLVTLFNA